MSSVKDSASSEVAEAPAQFSEVPGTQAPAPELRMLRRVARSMFAVGLAGIELIWRGC